MCKLVVIIKQFRELESFEEIRTRSELRLGTPSLKRPAKTFAPWVRSRNLGKHARLCRGKQTKRNASEPEVEGKAWRHRRRRFSRSGNWRNSCRHAL